MMYQIRDDEIWDLKKSIAEFLLPRLEEFRSWVVQGKMIGIPTWVRKDVSSSEMNEDQLKKDWIDILEEMIKGFEYYAGVKSGDNFEEINNQKGKSLELFYKYYDHLWD